MRYEFKCLDDGERLMFVCPYKERDTLHPHCPLCGQEMEQDYTFYGYRLGRKDGKDTGFYDYDYGKKATWDLTPPGKIERLKKAGTIHDPFDDVPPRSGDVEL